MALIKRPKSHNNPRELTRGGAIHVWPAAPRSLAHHELGNQPPKPSHLVRKRTVQTSTMCWS